MMIKLGERIAKRVKTSAKRHKRSGRLQVEILLEAALDREVSEECKKKEAA